MGKYGFKNLFGKSDIFFDKEATIKEYFALVPPEKRNKCETYDELYEEALKFVSKQDFKENTKEQENYFHEIDKVEGTVAVVIGIIAYITALEVDKNSKNIEKAIDKVLSKDYDKNNPYDSKQGRGHRVFGHDIFTFGLKNIPADTLIKVNNKAIKIGDFLGVGTTGKVSMWDLIWKFYGADKGPLKGVVSCLSHTIIHFAKDLFSKDGLPLPFSSLLEKYKLADVIIDGKPDKASIIYYKDSILKKTQKLGLELKASDLASMIIIEACTDLYIKSKEKALGDKAKQLKKDSKLISMGTCLALQMGTILTAGQLKTKGSANVPGGKVNSIMACAFMKLTISEMIDILGAYRDVKSTYKSGYMRGYYDGE